MSSKLPPVPPENRSDKGPAFTGPASTGPASAGLAEAAEARTDGPARERARNPDQQGQTANTKQNTTHQGYQQDR